MATPLSSIATQLRNTTGTPFGLACQRPRTVVASGAPTFGAPLGKGVAIDFEAASPKAPTFGAVNVDKLTELAIITLKEH